MAKILMKGNEAFGKAAMVAGSKYFYGNPITPQSEIPEYLSRQFTENGGPFVHAESEVAAINMVYGAGGCGARVLTSSSSPGIALKQEGITYCAGAEVPCVILNVVRGGPGLGSIQPSQSDYFMTTRGGGDGDYRTPVYAPASVQEACDMIMDAFDVAELYRTPVLVLLDGMIGQMMEPVDFDKPRKQRELPSKEGWATTGTKGKRKPNIINSLYLSPEILEEHNYHLQRKYDVIEANELQYEMDRTEDAELVFVAYGTMARVVKNCVNEMRAEGYKVGLIRPKTVWPYPYKAFDEIPACKNLFVIEMSLGQMVEDVKLGSNGRYPVHFYGRPGGMVPEPKEIIARAKEIMGGVK